MNKIIAFVKKETVLTVSWVLAIASAFIVRPDKEYIGYIDLKSIGTLWCLMIVVSALTEIGVFDRIGEILLGRTKYVWQLLALLVFLPFFSAMFITNDVALLTFVPFSIHILKMSDKERLLIPVVAFQTIGANLGSMLTPIGNPQNIYLFGLSKMRVDEFVLLMLPYTCISMLFLMACIITVKGKRKKIFENSDSASGIKKLKKPDTKPFYIAFGRKRLTAIFGVLFILAVLSVAFPTVVRYPIVVVVILITCLLIDKTLIVSIDYALLFTFVGFFIFTGNLGRIDDVRGFLVELVKGHEVVAAVVSSQFISNVPAALLLSEFTTNVKDLIVGVNIGGLGTLIASMASLISFKLLAHRYNEEKGKYLLYFTGVSIVFLFVLMGYALL